MTTHQSLTWYQKAFILTGIGCLGTLTITFIIFLLTSAMPPACKANFKDYIIDKKEHDIRMEEMNKRQDAFINRMERRIVIDSMLFDKVLKK